VDVARAISHGLTDDAVDKLHHGRLIVHIDLGRGGDAGPLIIRDLERLDEPVDIGVSAVSAIDERAHRREVAHEPTNRPSGRRLNGCPPMRRRVSAEHDHRLAVERDRNRLMGADDAFVEHRHHLGVELDALGVRRRDPQDLADRQRQFLAAAGKPTERQLRELEQVAVGQLQDRGQRLGRQLVAVDEQLAHLHAFRRTLSTGRSRRRHLS
jgi:hypothetical protein